MHKGGIDNLSREGILLSALVVCVSIGIETLVVCVITVNPIEILFEGFWVFPRLL